MVSEKDSTNNADHPISRLPASAISVLRASGAAMLSLKQKFGRQASDFAYQLVARSLATNAGNRHLTRFTESFDIVLWTFDYPGWHVRYASPSVGKLYGRLPSAFRRNPQLWQEYLHPGDRSRVAAICSRITAMESETFQCRIIHQDGDVR
ncbi:MAG: hypothetical protein H6R04_1042 [Burkholderiaceae bacterium]|nr:hypothetical protein [Burkholderiaceae bacterium]